MIFPTIKSLINSSTVGLIGDGMKSIHLDALYGRVEDQADRVGTYAPSWAAFIGELRSLGWEIDNVAFMVKLPKI